VSRGAHGKFKELRATKIFPEKQEFKAYDEFVFTCSLPFPTI